MNLNQKGITQFAVVIILLVGILGGLYLVRNPAIFKPKADESKITVDDSRISVTHSPNPVLADSQDITFVVSAVESILPTGKYFFKITSLNDSDCSMVGFIESKNRSNITIISTLQLTKSSSKTIYETGSNNQFAGCGVSAGNRKFELWYGDMNGSKYVLDYPFSVEQTGGGRAPEVSALNPELGLAENPEVQVRNARAGTTYTFWWDGAIVNLAQKYAATYDGTTDKIIINKNGVDFTHPGEKILCMEAGEGSLDKNLIPTGLTCNYKVVFDFGLLPPVASTYEPACSIEPANPTSNDSVTIKAVNLPKNQNFRADLMIQETLIHMPLQQNSGESGIVSLHLASSFGTGNYAARVYNTTTNEFICEQEFAVNIPQITPDTESTL